MGGIWPKKRDPPINDRWVFIDGGKRWVLRYSPTPTTGPPVLVAGVLLEQRRQIDFMLWDR